MYAWDLIYAAAGTTVTAVQNELKRHNMKSTHLPKLDLDTVQQHTRRLDHHSSVQGVELEHLCGRPMETNESDVGEQQKVQRVMPKHLLYWGHANPNPRRY